MRIAEPIAFSQIFPYINEFMEDLHLTDDPKRIGLYSGLVVRILVTIASVQPLFLTRYIGDQESIFAIFQLMAIYNMAKLSGRYKCPSHVLC